MNCVFSLSLSLSHSLDLRTRSKKVCLSFNILFTTLFFSKFFATHFDNINRFILRDTFSSYSQLISFHYIEVSNHSIIFIPAFPVYAKARIVKPTPVAHGLRPNLNICFGNLSSPKSIFDFSKPITNLFYST